jgi:hypothetical protein
MTKQEIYTGQVVKLSRTLSGDVEAEVNREGVGGLQEPQELNISTEKINDEVRTFFADPRLYCSVKALLNRKVNLLRNKQLVTSERGLSNSLVQRRLL